MCRAYDHGDHGRVPPLLLSRGHVVPYGLAVCYLWSAWEGGGWAAACCVPLFREPEDNAFRSERRLWVAAKASGAARRLPPEAR